MSENRQTDSGDSLENAASEGTVGAESESEVSAAGTASEPAVPGTVRRNFLVEIAAAVIGLIVGIVPALAGGLFFLHPLFKKQDEEAAGASGRQDAPVKDSEGRLKTTVTLDSLPADGSPLQLKMLDDIVDAWNLFPNQEIGSIWVRRVGDQVIAFNTICPHLGCAIEHRASQGDFYCPCHLSSFTIDGEKKNEIPPRDMDTLDVSVKDDGSVWVKYEKFRGAISEKVSV